MISTFEGNFEKFCNLSGSTSKFWANIHPQHYCLDPFAVVTTPHFFQGLQKPSGIVNNQSQNLIRVIGRHLLQSSLD